MEENTQIEIYTDENIYGLGIKGEGYIRRGTHTEENTYTEKHMIRKKTDTKGNIYGEEHI